VSTQAWTQIKPQPHKGSNGCVLTYSLSVSLSGLALACPMMCGWMTYENGTTRNTHKCSVKEDRTYMLHTREMYVRTSCAIGLIVLTPANAKIVSPTNLCGLPYLSPASFSLRVQLHCSPHVSNQITLSFSLCFNLLLVRHPCHGRNPFK
jgi:hypothetical protein